MDIMLVRLFGKNFRSFRDNFELSMVAANLTNQDAGDRGIVEVPLDGMDEPLRLLRVVALYGPNASGKSTVIQAAKALRWLVTSSSRSAEPGATIRPYEPFALDPECRLRPVELGCDVVCDGAILRYELQFDSQAIQSEMLTLLRGDKENRLIHRRGEEQVTGELIVRNDANQLYVKGMQPNVTVVSKLAQHGPAKGKDSIRPYFEALLEALTCRDYSRSAGESPILFGRQQRFAEDQDYRTWIMDHLIRPSDLGISDVETQRKDLNVPKEFIEHFRKIAKDRIDLYSNLVVTFRHHGTDNALIDFENESSGTRKLFHISHDWWALAFTDKALFADELGASLHPRILDRLVRAINDGPTNQSRSQLIFTTHETSLLEGRDDLPPALRRDQVYFTQKNAEGASELYSLVEFKDDARPVHNIRKRYMAGLYGALPFVEKLSL